MMAESQQQTRWREHLNNIEKMRCERNAPVDFMGCQQICDKSAAPEVSTVLLNVSDYYAPPLQGRGSIKWAVVSIRPSLCLSRAAT